jgi:hypothetical protein
MSRFGDLLGGKKAAPAPAPVAAPEPVVEVVEVVVEVPDPVVEEEVVEEPHFENMSKRQLEAYGREHGIELDRRHSHKKLVEELKEHLSNS